ncbi:hypothetical protein SH528x_000088 [Novipirellula sp. SH528]|uniref:hypothetical protein n=1 Tax=Novipirellula sp. SH528 TaxID=3454466 RepID=UPI003FA04770
MKFQRSKDFAIPVTLVLYLGCCQAISLLYTPPGIRLLTVQIESNDNVVYEGIRGVPDNTPVVEMWDILGDVPFKSTAKGSSVLDDDEKNAGKLEGVIVVRIKHVDKKIANASLKKLTLRSVSAGASWTLDGAEVERIKADAGG